MARTRISGFRDTHNKAGGLHVQFEPEAADLIREYCRATGQNCKKFVNQLVIDAITRLQKEQSVADSKATCKKLGDRQPSANGTFSPELDAELSYRIWAYCVATDQNRTEYVKRCVSDRLEVDERKLYIGMSQDQLIDHIIKLTRLAGKQEGNRDQGQLCLL